MSAESDESIRQEGQGSCVPRDLVLKKVLSFVPIPGASESPSYECPYVVKRAFSGNVSTLTTMDGEVHSFCERRCSQEILRLKRKEQLAKLKTRKGGLGKKEHLGGLKTRKDDPGKN